MSLPQTSHTESDGQRVALRGHQILDTPMLNKGSAFSEEERRELGLLGLLPPHIATMDEQLERTYANYCQKTDDLERYVFLTGLQDRNEVLFYRLLHAHIAEMTPIIYTPIVGAASQHYSHIYRRPRGLYIAYPDAAHIEQMLRNAPNPDVRVIVVTDGERILGLGDLGIGGMGIPIGKLSLYTLCAGIHPATTLPITLDVGTNNRELLDDPLYLGWRHERMRGSAYQAFIEAFVAAVMRVFPNAILQWEDFAKQNAATLLERYRDRLCTFNDDIQGTGAVTLAGLMAATDVADVPLREQLIVMLGAGSSVHGICDQIVAAMCADGATPEEARAAIWLVDSRGLVHAGRNDLGDEPFKVAYARPAGCTDGWERTAPGPVTLADIVHNVRPGILVGAAAQPGAFDEALVREMASHVDRPIIFPISNPTSKSEAVPADLLSWTDGRALIATGSPYAPVVFGDRTVTIGQCNNVFIFPGVGLGVLASGARRVTDGMFVAAARALSALSPARIDPAASLYPTLEDVRIASRHVALAVGAEAQRAGVADPCEPEELARRIDELMWEPHYTRLLPA
ncbi:NAD-dependent malic enzyme [Oscillochloris sp. ZM17-4]|uniref:NAD-dependent malic enzyme n=1 Tax=Oscillochloris sp. ZM17-4 TaxID=2866714 RepID=UPI001C736018|nr:NAD-dependent malic enzyme [Oscillochloris sp. ZM17-4]MBX0326124.1 NAD-dependent malic enzyme [Oscillochloris sp. ZM17-4]